MRPWLELARISNLPTVWTNVLAAWLLMGGGWQDSRLGWLLLAGSLIYTAGMILNDAADAGYDRQHRPERPIPRGAVKRATAWGVGLGMMAVGGRFAAVEGEAGIGITLALIAMVLFYDFYHKPWAGSVWSMGACRTLLYLVVASPLLADGETFSSSAIILPSVALGLYIVGLSQLARMEATGKGRTWLPQLLLYSPVLLALAGSGTMPALVLIGFAVGLLIWVRRAVTLMRSNPPKTIGPAVGRLLAGIVWVDALAIASAQPWTALGFVILVPVLMLWQRVVAAT